MIVLTHEQRGQLDECEAVIRTHENHFLAVADALITIRDGALWSGEFTSFDDYCQTRWKWSGRRGRQIIQSAETIRSVKAENPGVGNIVSGLSQRAALTLSQMTESKQVRALAEAAKTDKKITGSFLREASKAKIEPENPPVILDKTGYPIPEKRLALFMRGAEVDRMLQSVSGLRGAIRNLIEDEQNGTPDLLFVGVNLQAVMVSLVDVFMTLKTAIPYCVCTDCQGHRSETCVSCHGRGLISEYFWKNALPEEARALRKASVKK